MIHAGVGVRHVNAFLCTVGVPSISKTTLKRREHEIGHYLELAAKHSCKRASHDEKQLTLEAAGLPEDSNDVCASSFSQNTATEDDQINLDQAMDLLAMNNSSKGACKAWFQFSSELEFSGTQYTPSY